MALALVTGASAQQAPSATAPAAPVTTATAIGTVFDSVRMRPLAGARVRVDSSDIVGTADGDGLFRVEGIPPGAHHLRIEHPILDTLAIALRSPTEIFAAGAIVAAELATPSPERLIELVCAPAWRNRGPAVLLGRVREADIGTPATGAKVSLVWYELEVVSGVRRTPRVREAIVAADGTYRICGLPVQLDGKVQVLRGSLTSGEIPIAFGEDLLFLRSMTIAAPGAVVVVAPGSDSAGGAGPPVVLGTARLTGRVLNNAGRPLAGARVQLEGTTRTAVSRPTGDFVLDSLPAGTQTVAARLLGYAPVEQAVDLVSSTPSSVTIRMTDFVPVLEAVRVTAARERGLESVGFTRRKRTGQGHYFDEKDINKDSRNFSDVLRIAPGVRIVQASGGRQVITNNRSPNGCTTIYIDGSIWQQMEAGDIDDFVKPYELAAIEVYSPTTAPAEFQGRGTGCMTIVAWTYRRLDRERKR